MIRLFCLLALASALPSALPSAAAQTNAGEIPDDAPAWKPVAEAVELAEADGRLLLVHAYTVWCGWCARMDRETYADDAIQAYLAEHYVSTRLDLESDEVVPFFEYEVPMRVLGDALQISGTPTSVFVDSDGSLITKMPGFVPADQFLLALQYVREEAYELQSFEEFIEGRKEGPAPAEG